MLIIAAPLWLAATAATADPLPSRIDLPLVDGWTRTASAQSYPWTPRFDGADHRVTGHYRNGKGQVVDLTIIAYARQDEGRELVGFGQGAADPDSQWVWSSPARAPANARGEQITAPGPVVRHVVSFYVVGTGNPTGSRPVVKIETMKARLLGQDQRAVAILISAQEGEGQSADAAINAFLGDMGDVKLLADRAMGLR